MTSSTRFPHSVPENGPFFPLAQPKYGQTTDALPRFARNCPVTRRYDALLRPLTWSQFPERGLKPRGSHSVTWPHKCYVAALLVKLEEGLKSVSHLHRYLSEHPALCWLVGFGQRTNGFKLWGQRFQSQLPHPRHFNRVLRALPNEGLQALLTSSVHLLHQELAQVYPAFGQQVSLDTKLILAWVKENNPKAYVEDRHDPKRQPRGDKDCRLGVKRRRNVSPETMAPKEQPVAGSKRVKRPEMYWGYASGVVATKVPEWGEVVLAELTQPFNASDVSYFFPLMADTEARLGFRPQIGALDAAFDAFYVHEYFYRADGSGFAAVPLSQKGGYTERGFAATGEPICQAGLPMPRKLTYTDHTKLLIVHERGRHLCPLLYPEPTGENCPAQHERWPKGGCTADMPTAIGARVRYQLDRESEAFKAAYRQRTATERINAQAKALGIERPHLRNQHAITNQNTLIYLLINLRALQRIRQQKATLLT